MFQEGNQEARKKRKPWREAIERALKRSSEGKIDYLAIDECADALIKAAREGDIQALKEIGDRLEGRPSQAITGGDDDDKPLIPSKIEIVLVDAIINPESV